MGSIASGQAFFLFFLSPVALAFVWYETMTLLSAYVFIYHHWLSRTGKLVALDMHRPAIQSCQKLLLYLQRTKESFHSSSSKEDEEEKKKKDLGHCPLIYLCSRIIL